MDTILICTNLQMVKWEPQVYYQNRSRQKLYIVKRAYNGICDPNGG